MHLDDAGFMRLLDEDTDEQVRAEGIAHIEECEQCRAELDMLVTTMNQVEAALDWMAANPGAFDDDDDIV